jgi:multiple sugar transport system ATP-binding protein
MSTITLRNLCKSFGAVKAVDCLDLHIEDGDFVTLLGPSGCGKTTTLRCLSGLEEPDRGEICIGDTCVFSSTRGVNLRPGQRNLGLVFQNYALWPHMKVRQNVAFGLRKARLDREKLEEKIAWILKLVGLEGYADRYPHELSGGQQQRVAVARMVVTQPRILLFDEPLSNLDAKLRMRLRSELKRLHLDLGATTVYVTHDQVEAMALSDRIVVMKDGVMQQVGSPYEVYHFPANLFVADFMGNPETNLLAAKVSAGGRGLGLVLEGDAGAAIALGAAAELSPEQSVTVNIRPEDIEISRDSGPQSLRFRVYTTQPMGSEVLVHLRAQESDLQVVAKNPEERCLGLEPEMSVGVSVKRGNVYDGQTGLLLCSFGFGRADCVGRSARGGGEVSGARGGA